VFSPTETYYFGLFPTFLFKPDILPTEFLSPPRGERRYLMKLISLPGFEMEKKPPLCLAKGPLYIICGPLG
jgi:hypothetical protein